MGSRVVVCDARRGGGPVLGDGERLTFADVIERWVDRFPGRAAVIDADGSTITYEEMAARSRVLASNLAGRLTRRQATVGVYLRNSAAYLGAYLAASMASAVPFNVNHRYTATEVRYLIDNAEAEAMVVQAEFVPVVVAALAVASTVRVVYVVADDTAADLVDVRALAVRVAVVMAGELEVASSSGGTGAADQRAVERVDPFARHPDDLMFLYTGGTTGLPKATMWRQGDLVAAYGTTMSDLAGDRPGGEPLRTMSVAPLMHGTGLISQLSNLFGGGTVVIGSARRFDPAETWELVARHRVNVLTIVGDPFARPLLDALRYGAPRDLPSLMVISSSGAMWSQHVKDGLHDLLGETMLYDSFASSEAMGLGASVTRARGEAGTAVFALGRRARVLADDGTWVLPGSAIPGRVAVSEPLPVGYFKDEAKSASTFVVVDGIRYAIPGDYVLVNADGSLTLLGRGSSCINTGGEKVFPEEVEEVLKQHPAIRDAACIGVHDERFGEVVGALVQPEAGAEDTLVPADVVEFARRHLARFKAPRHVVVVRDLGRGSNGKLDRPALYDLLVLASSGAAEHQHLYLSKS